MIEHAPKKHESVSNVMVGKYFVIVDKRDSERFRKFKLGKFNNETNRILKDSNCAYIWSFHKGQIKNDIWKQMKKNDYVLFAVPPNNFQIVGQVTKKIVNQNIGKLMWPDDLDAKQLTHFLLFERLHETDQSYHDVIQSSTSKITVPIPSIYEIKKESHLKILAGTENETYRVEQKSSPKPFVPPKSKHGHPQKSKSEVNRFLRDSALVKKLKKLYADRCQICGFTFEYQLNKFYSEVHHYNPLEENGNDDIDNMIVVCPNHHSELDYKMIAIDYDGTTIIDKTGNKIGKISFHDGHKLSQKNIQSQLRVV